MKFHVIDPESSCVNTTLGATFAVSSGGVVNRSTVPAAGAACDRPDSALAKVMAAAIREVLRCILFMTRLLGGCADQGDALDWVPVLVRSLEENTLSSTRMDALLPPWLRAVMR